jgi:hypothetical protein
MGVKVWAARKLYNILVQDAPAPSTKTASSGSGKARDLVKGIIKRLGLRTGEASNDFEPPEDDFSGITAGYAADSYIRQGVDKYVDQMFKEGYEIFGKNQEAVDYLKLRLAFIAEGTGIPTGQLLQDIAEDIVKYSNAIIAKARMTDPAQLPPGIKVQGLYGLQPVVGYFPLNVTTMYVKRDKNGTVKGWQQQSSSGSGTVNFKTTDIIHIWYKRQKGNAFGTPFLLPVLDDVRALRQAEENVLRLMYRSIYPFYHIAVGTDEEPGRPEEVKEVQETVNNMDVEGGIATTNRVTIKPIASDQVINAEPYLKYFEERVFSGMGIPAIMFGRGNTANRNTGDNMTTEMGDRVRAMQSTIEMFVTEFMFKELLMEGGYDPVMNPDDRVELVFHENDVDRQIKAETHAIYQYEHNAITEDEMRSLLGRDPITDRARMYLQLVEIPKVEAQAQADITVAKATGKTTTGTSSKSTEGTSATKGTKETNNKQKPTNQYGTKMSPKKQTNQQYERLIADRYQILRYAIDDLLTAYNASKDQANIAGVAQAIKNTCKYIYQINDEIYGENGEISKIYYTRLFKQLHDDVMEYIAATHDIQEAKHLISTTLDIFEDKLHLIASNTKLFEGKEGQVDEAHTD